MFLFIAVFLVTCSAAGFVCFTAILVTIPEKKKEARDDHVIRKYVQLFNMYSGSDWLLLETTSTGYVLKWKGRSEFFTFEDSRNAVMFIESLR